MLTAWRVAVLSTGQAVCRGRLQPAPATATSAPSSVERYDPGTDAWEAVAPLTLARFGAGVAALDGKLYAVGGRIEDDEVDRPANTVERYDPATNAWGEVVAPMATGRAFPFALLM